MKISVNNRNQVHVFKRHWQKACNASKDDNIEIMIGKKIFKTINQPFESIGFI